jgi:hypothetical protein
MGSAWASGGGLDRQQGQCPLRHISLEAHADGEPCLLHHATTGGITWRVLLRPELRRAGESEVVEFQKLGRSGKLLDQVIGWGDGSCAERQQQAAAARLSFPSCLSAELLAAPCLGFDGRPSRARSTDDRRRWGATQRAGPRCCCRSSAARRQPSPAAALNSSWTPSGGAIGIEHQRLVLGRGHCQHHAP